MNKIKLSNRLLKCAQMITEGESIADIGTDHAYIPIYLMLNGKISHAIASDIGNGPLKNATANIKKYNLENKIETRISNGLQNINSDEAKEIIIAGMGGNLISGILQECRWNNKEEKTFILNPMKYEERLRNFLYSNGYEITEEHAVICSKKVYTVMKVLYTGKNTLILPKQKYIGKMENNLGEAETIYIRKQIKNLKNHLRGAKFEHIEEKEIYYKSIINSLEELLK